jgi:hypothetical protein
MSAPAKGDTGVPAKGDTDPPKGYLLKGTDVLYYACREAKSAEPDAAKTVCG